MQYRQHSAVSAAVFGGLTAVFIAYGLCAAGVMGRFANVTAPAAFCPGWAGLTRAAVNLYVMQHVSVRGLMVVDSIKYSDAITLPLTIWVIIPAIAVFFGGYGAGIRRRNAGASAAILAGVGAGVVYALLLIALSPLFKTIIDPSALPSMQGISFNPNPKMLMGPSLLSSVVYTGFTGVLFGFLGGKMASRNLDALNQPGKWWACAKSVIIAGKVVLLILISIYGFWVFRQIPNEKLQDTSRWQLFTYAPAVSCLGYSAMNGEDILWSLTSSLDSSSGFGGRVNIYRGTVDAARPAEVKPFSAGVTAIAAAVMALASFFMGALAVRWGSRDGSVLTAARIAVIAALYLLTINLLSWFGWSSAIGSVQAKLAVIPVFTKETFYTLAGIFFFSLMGAHSIRIWYVRRRGFPT